jgi:1,6-anhydro-N-acetylmuramate kinase
VFLESALCVVLILHVEQQFSTFWLTDHIVELKDEMEDVENENTLLKNERRATAATVADLQRRVEELTAAMASVQTSVQTSVHDSAHAAASGGGDHASSQPAEAHASDDA